MFLALTDWVQDDHFGKSFCGGGIFLISYLSFFVIVVVVVCLFSCTLTFLISCIYFEVYNYVEV